MAPRRPSPPASRGGGGRDGRPLSGLRRRGGLPGGVGRWSCHDSHPRAGTRGPGCSRGGPGSLTCLLLPCTHISAQKKRSKPTKRPQRGTSRADPNDGKRGGRGGDAGGGYLPVSVMHPRGPHPSAVRTALLQLRTRRAQGGHGERREGHAGAPWCSRLFQSAGGGPLFSSWCLFVFSLKTCFSGRLGGSVG